MKEELKQKLASYYWDLEEIERTIGKNKMSHIVDCNEEMLIFDNHTAMTVDGQFFMLLGYGD